MSCELGYWRTSVGRDTTVRELQSSAAQFCGGPRARLHLSGESIDEGQTVGSLGLFARARELQVEALPPWLQDFTRA